MRIYHQEPASILMLIVTVSKWKYVLNSIPLFEGYKTHFQRFEGYKTHFQRFGFSSY